MFNLTLPGFNRGGKKKRPNNNKPTQAEIDAAAKEERKAIRKDASKAFKGNNPNRANTDLYYSRVNPASRSQGRVQTGAARDFARGGEAHGGGDWDDWWDGDGGGHSHDWDDWWEEGGSFSKEVTGNSARLFLGKDSGDMRKYGRHGGIIARALKALTGR